MKTSAIFFYTTWRIKSFLLHSVPVLFTVLVARFIYCDYVVLGLAWFMVFCLTWLGICELMATKP